MPTLKTLRENPKSNYLSKLATVESGNNPKAKAKTSSASGLFQFTESTWSELNDKYKLGYTLNDRFDPAKSRKMAGILTKENENAIKPIIGRELNDGERYLGHFLGAQGSRELLSSYLKNPNERVGNVVSGGALKANKSVFLNRDGSQKTVGDIYNWASKKMKIQPVYVNTAETYSNEQQPTQTINYLQIPEQLTNFASVPENEARGDEPQKEEVDAETEKVEKESSFLRELENLSKQDYSYLEPQKTQQQALPQVDFMQQYEQISQFIDNETAQQGGKYTDNEISFLSEIAIKDNQGQRNHPNKVTKIEGNTMATDGYGEIPLYVIPNKGKPKIVNANTGQHTFKGATEFIEIPLFKNK